MKRVLAASITLLVVGTACGGDGTSSGPSGTPSNEPTAGFKTYTDAGNGFTIKYPPDWEEQQSPEGAAVAFLAPKEDTTDRFRENINVLIQSLPDPDMSLQEYTDLSTRQGPQLIEGFKVLDQDEISVGGHAANRVHYTGGISGNDFEWEAVWLVEGGKAYVITFTASPDRFSDYIERARAALNSFQLIA
jgi:hypothetical protein